MRYHRSLSVVCLLAVSTLACHDVTRSESDLPGWYTLEAIDGRTLPMRAGGVAATGGCRITGGTLHLDATGHFTLRDELDCASQPGRLVSAYGGSLVPDPDHEFQAGTYTSTGHALTMHSDMFIIGGWYRIAPEYITAPYSSDAIAMDPTRFYGDTTARRRVYIRSRNNNEPDASVN